MAKKKKAAVAAKPPTKSEIYKTIAEDTGLSRAQVVEVVDSLSKVMTKSLKKHKVFNLIGLAKMTLVHKAAIKGGKMVKNPFTGEMVPQKPRAASKNVKIRALKSLKDMVN